MGVLISWATPAARWPMDSSFCACASCASSTRRSLVSRMKLVIERALLRAPRGQRELERELRPPRRSPDEFQQFSGRAPIARRTDTRQLVAVGLPRGPCQETGERLTHRLRLRVEPKVTAAPRFHEGCCPSLVTVTMASMAES